MVKILKIVNMFFYIKFKRNMLMINVILLKRVSILERGVKVSKGVGRIEPALNSAFVSRNSITLHQI